MYKNDFLPHIQAVKETLIYYLIHPIKPHFKVFPLTLDFHVC